MSIQYDQLGRNVRAIRRKRNLTQKVLAELLGCSTEHLCHIESGKRHMQLDMLERFCERTEVSYQEVLRFATSVPISSAETNEQDNFWWQAEFEAIVSGCSECKIQEILEICRKIVCISRS